LIFLRRGERMVTPLDFIPVARPSANSGIILYRSRWLFPNGCAK
jgi:hypothetical protein